VLGSLQFLYVTVSVNKQDGLMLQLTAISSSLLSRVAEHLGKGLSLLSRTTPY